MKSENDRKDEFLVLLIGICFQLAAENKAMKGAIAGSDPDLLHLAQVDEKAFLETQGSIELERLILGIGDQSPKLAETIQRAHEEYSRMRDSNTPS